MISQIVLCLRHLCPVVSRKSIGGRLLRQHRGVVSCSTSRMCDYSAGIERRHSIASMTLVAAAWRGLTMHAIIARLCRHSALNHCTNLSILPFVLNSMHFQLCCRCLPVSL